MRARRALAAFALAIVVVGGCGPGDYPSYEGGDLDCSDIDGPVRVDGPDPHGLDRDNDGIGCE